MPVFNDGITTTARPEGAGIVTTDVLIVGSGPAGSSASLFLSNQGIPNIMITKYRWTANTPRAHITNQRTMESASATPGIEDQVLAAATPHELIGDTVYCDIPRRRGDRPPTLPGARVPIAQADYELASPFNDRAISRRLYLEPILVKNAAMRGTQIQFSTEYLSHTPGWRRRQCPGAEPSHRTRIHHSCEVPHWCRWRPVQGGCRHRAPHGGPDGHRVVP